MQPNEIKMVFNIYKSGTEDKVTICDWHCRYHIVWIPKYRYKVLKSKVGEEERKTVAGLEADYQAVYDYLS